LIEALSVFEGPHHPLADLEYRGRTSRGPICPARDPMTGRVRLELHGEGVPGALIWMDRDEAEHLARGLLALTEHMAGESYPVKGWFDARTM
jgi:hypothetical protein